MPFFYIIFKHFLAPKRSGKVFTGSWKVLDFFVSERVGTLKVVDEKKWRATCALIAKSG